MTQISKCSCLQGKAAPVATPTRALRVRILSPALPHLLALSCVALMGIRLSPLEERLGELRGEQCCILKLFQN